MNPALLLRERKFQFGDVTARQTVSVLGSEEHAYLFVCTTFTVRFDDGYVAHQAQGSRLECADADQLTDEGRREQLARQHLVGLATDLHRTADALSAALAPKLEAVAP